MVSARTWVVVAAVVVAVLVALLILRGLVRGRAGRSATRVAVPSPRSAGGPSQPGWYADPDDPARTRFWNGARWQ